VGNSPESVILWANRDGGIGQPLRNSAEETYRGDEFSAGCHFKTALFQSYEGARTRWISSSFFQKHWDLCVEKACVVVLQVLKGEDDPSDINNICIILIPNVERPEELGQYPPISLCNVIYNIASKIVVNRLWIILSDVILEEQSAFMPGQLITDNVITAYECLHFMKKKRAQYSRCGET